MNDSITLLCTGVSERTIPYQNRFCFSMEIILLQLPLSPFGNRTVFMPVCVRQGFPILRTLTKPDCLVRNFGTSFYQNKKQKVKNLSVGFRKKGEI